MRAVARASRHDVGGSLVRGSNDHVVARARLPWGLDVVLRWLGDGMWQEMDVDTNGYPFIPLFNGKRWNHLTLAVKDKLVIISNILYWLYVDQNRKPIDTILIENTSEKVINKLIELFPEIQIIGSSNE